MLFPRNAVLEWPRRYQDNGLARRYFQKACEGGIASACTGLGNLYFSGQGGAQDYTLAGSTYGEGL